MIGDNKVYGLCMHGNSMITCYECHPVKVEPIDDLIEMKKSVEDIMKNKKDTHIAISTDITSSAVYLQRLEPTTASENPLTKQEEIILHLYRRLELEKKETEELKGLIQVSEDKYREVLLDNALGKEYKPKKISRSGYQEED